MLSGAKACKSCRSRQELSNEYLLARFGFNTAEKEPLKVCQKLAKVRTKVRKNIGRRSLPERRRRGVGERPVLLHARAPSGDGVELPRAARRRRGLLGCKYSVNIL